MGMQAKKGFGARFFNGFNAGFKSMTNKYIQSLKFLIRHKWIALTGLVIVAGVSFWLVQKTPTGFIPTEDQGFVLYAVNTPPGSSLDRTRQATQAIDNIVKKEAVDRTICMW